MDSPAWLNRLRTSPLRALYERLPEDVQRSYRAASHTPSRLTWRIDRRGARHSSEHLEPLRGCFEGRRAILIGNGPSLRRTSWRQIEGEFSIGSNRVYLLAREVGFLPNLYTCVNDLVLRQFGGEIAGLPCFKILDWWHGRRYVPTGPRTVFLPEVPSLQFREEPVSDGWSHGFTVTFAAMQIAYYLGFSQLILLGVDHRFRAAGPAMREVVSQGPDENHFTPDYFSSGTHWHLPNLSGSEAAYRLAHAAYVADGRSIIDATEGGALEVFPKSSLSAALAESPYPPPAAREIPPPLRRNESPLFSELSRSDT